MNSNQGNNQQQKQSGGYKISPTKESTPSKTKRRTPSRSRGPHPFQNQAELQRVMSLFQ